MDQQAYAPQTALTRDQRRQFAVLGLALVAVVAIFERTFPYLYGVWHQEEYSHGFLVPVISAFLLWQRRGRIAQVGLRPSWAGVAIVAVGIAIHLFGMLASITTVDTYALVIVLLGIALALMGWPAFRIALVPLALLFLMNPIPNFFYYNLSSQLQLMSSQLGVAFMRLCGVSVFLEGNVIDLGNYKLQVAEACSGLRYLFPLMTLGVIMAYLFKGRAWMRWCLFLSTIPITVLMNGLRIGVIGVLVDRFGIAQAEGFLHQFEGWLVFMSCFAVLLGLAWLLLRLTGERRSWRDLVSFGPPPPRAAAAPTAARVPGKPALALLLLLLLAVVPARAVPTRMEVRPQRADFTEFPLLVGGWHGRRQTIEAVYLDTLKLDDYVMADFVRNAVDGTGSGTAPGADSGVPINFYVAYYASQRTGQSVHSPRSCLPGGGWRILEFGQHAVQGVRTNGTPLRVNRAIVQHGNDRELVYYWFQERGRNITNEYLVKWYLLEDAVLRNRTDGALVRLITPLRDNEPAAAADGRLAQFAGTVLPALRDYLPN
ncbi:MAG TPA: VPLPA-CTERM-specific exosortase XrtD [Steroidobacteraceae bacterium]|nr:VPLPA-CTERM-specific exosortase XrtD [Steroidobacteraceae bacterium]